MLSVKSLNLLYFFPTLRDSWTQKLGGPCMCSGTLPNSNPHYFYSQRTTQPCPVGSRAWKSLFRNVNYGQRRGGYMYSARTSSVCPIAPTAAASMFYLIKPILLLKNLSNRSSLSHMATSVTFTQSIIVNSTSLNSTGV